MLRAGEVLSLLTFALLAVGVVMVTSAGLSVGGERSIGLAAVLLGRPGLFAGLAVLALLVGAAAPVHRVGTGRGLWAVAPWAVATAAVLLLLVHVPGLGREVNGARRWLELGPVRFQPSEVAKWTLPVFLAWYAAVDPRRAGRFAGGFAAPMAVVGALAALVALEDLGTAVLLVGASLVVLVAAGARPLSVLALLPVGAAGFVAAVLHSPYRLERLRSFVDPFGDPQGAGYHMIQSMAAVSGGGLAGRGLGNGIQKFGYLPEDTTDFIFAIACEELGVVGAAALVALYAGVLLAGLRVVRRARDGFARLLALGITTTIGLQALINLAVVTGCGPTKGIALPLVSAGGTGWLLTAFSIGLLVAIDRDAEERVMPDVTVPRSPRQWTGVSGQWTGDS